MLELARSIAPSGSRHRYRQTWKWAMTRWLLVLACMVLLSCAHAESKQVCDQQTLDVLGNHLGIADFEPVDFRTETGVVLAAACKPSPLDSHLELAAVSYVLPGSKRQPDDDQPDSRGLLVAIVDTATGKVQHSYKTTIEEDAATEVGENSLSLDTARYDLAPGVRAFGVVFVTAARGASCPDAGEDYQLTLYVPDGEKLRPIFDTYLQGWNTLKGLSCRSDQGFIAERAEISIGVEKMRSHGYADLLLSAKVVNDPPDGDSTANANNVKPTRVVRRVLHFDGKSYPSMSEVWFWQTAQAAQ